MFGSAMDLGMPVTVTRDRKAASKPPISMSTPQAPTIPPDACNLSAVVAGWIRRKRFHCRCPCQRRDPNQNDWRADAAPKGSAPA
jgi:hypothetical protein